MKGNNYLLDTHCLLFWLLEEKSLSKKVLKILKKPENNFFISSMSILEVQYLVEIGRLEIEMGDIFSYIDSTPNFNILAFDRPALIESLKLDSHRDPFDRIIVATAQAYKLRLLTKDLRILKIFPKLAIW
ncbi:MAG: type II toxin-antitoxin system VapC family toxin [Spirochaetia bacterium]|nr:type II toxin-antitoxin system VapC family toxin [Spirochaetia bacterium]